MIVYFAALIPLYIVVWLPLSNLLWGSTPAPRRTGLSNQRLRNGSFIALEDDAPDAPARVCPEHKYATYILNQEPLVAYIEGFLSAEESAHLVAVSEPIYTASNVTSGAETIFSAAIRKSSVALLDRDATVRCIEDRARAFQGWRDDVYLERLKTQKYGVGGHYTHHFDWSGVGRDLDRVSSFMVYVDAVDVVGGGTEFPRIRKPRGARWCEFLVCEGGEGSLNLDKGRGAEGDVNGEGGERKKRSEMGLDGDGLGVIFKPIKGNAVFWENLRPDGRGYEETFHAGLPVLKGEKVGLNIWTWGPPRGW